MFLFAAPAWAAATVEQEDIEPPAMAAMPCHERPFSVLLTVQNVKDGKGLITADVHDDNPDRWLKGGQHLVRVRVPAVKGETKMCVPLAAAGVYAIAIYHDKNANRRFDKNFLGLPSEPYGISNNPPINFGPPSLEESAFKVNGPLVPMTIRLKP
ncbi:MAG: DUF2141 domain-containing protein [Rhodospirillaceae bacterium]